MLNVFFFLMIGFSCFNVTFVKPTVLLANDNNPWTNLLVDVNNS